MSDAPLKLTGAGAGESDDEAGAGSSSSSSSGSKKRKRGGDEAPGARQRRRNDAELGNRLDRVFDRLVEWLEGRGDTELAEAIREDAGAMRGGLVSLTKPIAAIRGPLLVVLAIAEPLLAFGRVARILGGRLAARRAGAAELRAAERDRVRAEWQAIADDASRPHDEREEAARQVAIIDAAGG